jgi:hypothetical protein
MTEVRASPRYSHSADAAAKMSTIGSQKINHDFGEIGLVSFTRVDP